MCGSMWIMKWFGCQTTPPGRHLLCRPLHTDLPPYRSPPGRHPLSTPLHADTHPGRLLPYRPSSNSDPPPFKVSSPLPQKQTPAPVNRMTDVCENITFPHTLYVVGKKCSKWKNSTKKNIHHFMSQSVKNADDNQNS